MQTQAVLSYIVSVRRLFLFQQNWNVFHYSPYCLLSFCSIFSSHSLGSYCILKCLQPFKFIQPFMFYSFLYSYSLLYFFQLFEFLQSLQTEKETEIMVYVEMLGKCVYIYRSESRAFIYGVISFLILLLRFRVRHGAVTVLATIPEKSRRTYYKKQLLYSGNHLQQFFTKPIL